MNEKQAQILRLKKEKDAVIMAHYYVEDDIQEITPPVPAKEDNKSWQSKDFLELDDDMEFEFLDL